MSTSNQSNDILILQRQAPYGNSLARDGIDFVLTSAAYDQNISILFMGDGVFQLTQKQVSTDIQLKNHAGALEILPLYDVEQIFIVKEDLEARNLVQTDILDIAHIITRDQAKAMIHRHSKVIGF